MSHVNLDNGTGRTAAPPRRWLFLTSHGYVLLHLARAPDASAEEVAKAVGITARQAQRIIADLVVEGYVERQRVGRRNRYAINRDARFRHARFDAPPLSTLLDAFAAAAAAKRERDSAAPTDA